MGIVRPWEGRGKGNPAALFAQNICGAFKWHAQTKPQLHTRISSWGPAPFRFHQAPRPPGEAVSVQDEESCPVHQDLPHRCCWPGNESPQEIFWGLQGSQNACWGSCSCSEEALKLDRAAGRSRTSA